MSSSSAPTLFPKDGNIILASLKGHFFIESPSNGAYAGRSVAKIIVDMVNYPTRATQVKPIIRFPLGIWGRETDRIGAHAWSGEVEEEVRQMFWHENKPLITNPNAELYVGFYGPDFEPRLVVCATFFFFFHVA
jgi:hypothetical protein